MIKSEQDFYFFTKVSFERDKFQNSTIFWIKSGIIRDKTFRSKLQLPWTVFRDKHIPCCSLFHLSTQQHEQQDKSINIKRTTTTASQGHQHLSTTITGRGCQWVEWCDTSTLDPGRLEMWEMLLVRWKSRDGISSVHFRCNHLQSRLHWEIWTHSKTFP